MDASVHDFLHDLVKLGGGGENTAVVLASDHGTGFAPLYLTQVLYGLSREPILLIGLLICYFVALIVLQTYALRWVIWPWIGWSLKDACGWLCAFRARIYEYTMPNVAVIPQTGMLENKLPLLNLVLPRLVWDTEGVHEALRANQLRLVTA